MDKVFVKVNDLWVKDSWSSVGTVMLTAKESERQPIGKSEIKWLKKHFENVKAYKVEMVEVEI